jgi:ribonuclease P protein component
MDESFGKSERLCLKRRFDSLLAEGNSFFVYPFRVIYLEINSEKQESPVQAAFSVKKKQFKRAVARNLIKRRIRESWRRQKEPLYEMLRQHNKTLLILFVYGAEVALPYSDISKKTGQCIRKLMDQLTTSAT